jgi:hypothetical protein
MSAGEPFEASSPGRGAGRVGSSTLLCIFVQRGGNV